MEPDRSGFRSVYLSAETSKSHHVLHHSMPLKNLLASKCRKDPFSHISMAKFGKIPSCLSNISLERELPEGF